MSLGGALVFHEGQGGVPIQSVKEATVKLALQTGRNPVLSLFDLLMIGTVWVKRMAFNTDQAPGGLAGRDASRHAGALGGCKWRSTIRPKGNQTWVGRGDEETGLIVEPWGNQGTRGVGCGKLSCQVCGRDPLINHSVTVPGHFGMERGAVGKVEIDLTIELIVVLFVHEIVEIAELISAKRRADTGGGGDWKARARSAEEGSSQQLRAKFIATIVAEEGCAGRGAIRTWARRA